MAHHPLAFVAIILSAAMIHAAEPPVKNPEFLRQYALTRGFMLGRPVKPMPTPDGSAVLFLRSEARSPVQSLYEFDVATKQTRELLSPAKLLGGSDENVSPEEKARRERQRVSAGGFADFQISEDGKRVLVSLSGQLYVLDRKNGKADELQTGPGPLIDPKFSPDGGRVAYVREYDVFVYDLAANRETRVTTGGTRKKTHGLAEFVAEEEMDRHSGYWWSPDGKHITYEEADAAGVEVWYVSDPAHPENPPQPQYYPRPGKKNVAVRLGIVPATGGETVWVDWDRAKFEYLASVRWDKHGPLTLTVQDRKQQNAAILGVDTTNGSVAPILSDADSAWVNLRIDVPVWLPDGRFLWVTDRPTGAELELRQSDGTVVGPVVPASHGFHELFGRNSDGQYVYGRGDDPTRQTVWPAKIQILDGTKPPEYHDAIVPQLQTVAFNKQTPGYVLTKTTPGTLPTATFRSGSGNSEHVLASVAEEPPFKPNVELTKVGDGNGFYAAMVRPRDFDPKKKYPVIVDVYGGPKHQHVLAAMRNWLLPQWLADQGFIVVAIDGRGTPHRGRDWERAIYQKFGSVPLDDQVAGLQALGKKFPEMDLSRVGIVGWSFGGYLSALAVLKRPDVFHAAVAGAPVCDWLDYDTHYTERYLGMPQENPEAYKEASLLTYADKLSRPLLIVHGTADDNVFFRHSLRLSDSLFRAGKPFEVLPLPGLTHMVPDPVVTEQLWTRIAGHFRKHLGGRNKST